jgi:hypothetical protein
LKAKLAAQQQELEREAEIEETTMKLAAMRRTLQNTKLQTEIKMQEARLKVYEEEELQEEQESIASRDELDLSHVSSHSNAINFPLMQNTTETHSVITSNIHHSQDHTNPNPLHIPVSTSLPSSNQVQHTEFSQAHYTNAGPHPEFHPTFPSRPTSANATQRHSDFHGHTSSHVQHLNLKQSPSTSVPHADSNVSALPSGSHLHTSTYTNCRLNPAAQTFQSQT